MGQDPQNPVDHMQPCGIPAVRWRAVENPGRLRPWLGHRSVESGLTRQWGLGAWENYALSEKDKEFSKQEVPSGGTEI